jgi:hypothetical protein
VPFEERHKTATALTRDLWLTRDRARPDYAGRPWLLWSANRAGDRSERGAGRMGGGAEMMLENEQEQALIAAPLPRLKAPMRPIPITPSARRCCSMMAR